uniref:Uncharacterized protein n=1 Tax=Erythrolobus madagascarensis TaxID=708628 RepID=A0A7S0TAG9_9RHOD
MLGGGNDDDVDSELASVSEGGTRRVSRKAIERQREAEALKEARAEKRMVVVQRAAELETAFEDAAREMQGEAERGGKRVARKQRSARQELAQSAESAATGESVVEVSLAASMQTLSIRSARERVRWRVCEHALGMHVLRTQLELSAAVRDVFALGPPVVSSLASVTSAQQSAARTTRRAAARKAR